MTYTLGKPKNPKLLSIRCIVCDSSTFKLLFLKKRRSFYQCLNCGLEMQYPLPSIADLESYYDESYKMGLYRDFVNAYEMKRQTARYRFEKISKYIKFGRLLDVGCSDGLFVKETSENGIESEGIDISEVAIRRAKSNGVIATRASVESFNPGYRFQTITAFDVLEHVLSPADFILSVKNILEPGGQLILSTPNINSIHRFLMGKYWYFYIPEEHLFYFNPQTIKKFLVRNDFNRIEWNRLSKPLTLEYGLSQFAEYNPFIYKILKITMAMLPGKVNTFTFKFYIGEMMVIAKNNNSRFAPQSGHTAGNRLF